MKKVLVLLLTFAMIFSLAACGEETADDSSSAIKVGMVCIGDENAAYDRNFYMAADAATEVLASKGIDVEWLYTYNHPEGDPVAVDCEELADSGCQVVFLNSYGMEPAMLTVAADYPDTIFASLTNEASQRDALPNTINAFPSIYEGRYLAGVAAGCKLQEMIDSGEITPAEAVMGYVGAFTFAEVVSGYTAFYLGAKSVCKDVTMLVKFIGSWGEPTMEAEAAQDLIDNGAILVSQHSDSTTPASTARQQKDKTVYHVGYNISMTDVAPDSSIISSRIDWTNYFVYVIETIANGGTVDQDYMGHGIAEGDVVLTDLNEAIAASSTKDKIAEAEAAIKAGTLHVFDTTTFTVGGVNPTEALVDMDGDFAGDEGYNAIFDGYYHESYFKSAPSFDLRIDGIKLLNEAY